MEIYVERKTSWQKKWKPQTAWRNVGLSQNDKILRNAYKASSTETVVKGQRIWSQKIKIQWIRGNPSFFHRRSSDINVISMIECDDGRDLFEEREIADKIVGYYQNLYKKKCDYPFTFDGSDWRPLNAQNSALLESPFEENEIAKAIQDMGNLKSPRPDGMTRVLEHFKERLSKSVPRVLSKMVS